MRTLKIAVRLREDLVEFLDADAAKHKENRSWAVAVAVVQRQLSLLPPEDRERVVRRFVDEDPVRKGARQHGGHGDTTETGCGVGGQDELFAADHVDGG